MRTIHAFLIAGSLMLASVLSAPAGAAVVATVPYQLTAAGQCAGGLCTFHYPLIAAKRRLDIRFASCYLITADSNLRLGIPLLAIDNIFTPPVYQIMLWNMRTGTAGTSGEISQTVLLTISANHRPQIGFSYVSAASVTAACNIYGDLLFLQ